MPGVRSVFIGTGDLHGHGDGVLPGAHLGDLPGVRHGDGIPVPGVLAITTTMPTTVPTVTARGVLRWEWLARAIRVPEWEVTSTVAMATVRALPMFRIPAIDPATEMLAVRVMAV